MGAGTCGSVAADPATRHQAPQEAVVVLVWSLVMHVISTTYHGQPVSPQADNIANYGYWLI